MSDQPEALRLADALDSVVGGALCNQAAAELRRLHAERDALRAALHKLEYDSEGYIKRYPEESEVNAALKEMK